MRCAVLKKDNRKLHREWKPHGMRLKFLLQNDFGNCEIASVVKDSIFKLLLAEEDALKGFLHIREVPSPTHAQHVALQLHDEQNGRYGEQTVRRNTRPSQR